MRLDLKFGAPHTSRPLLGQTGMQLTLGPCLCASHETRSSAASTCRSAVGSLASAPLAQRRSRCSSRRWSLNHRTGAFGSGSHGSHVQHRACHSRRRSLACSASPHGPEDTKTALLDAVAETDRGIFGVPVRCAMRAQHWHLALDIRLLTGALCGGSRMETGCVTLCYEKATDHGAVPPARRRSGKPFWASYSSWRRTAAQTASLAG